MNDRYTAVQAVDHLSVIFCALATRPLGDDIARGSTGRTVVIVPGRRFADYLATMCGLIRRYGAQEPTVALALLRLLTDCASFVRNDPVRSAAIGEQATLVLAAAERDVKHAADLAEVRATEHRLQIQLAPSS